MSTWFARLLALLFAFGVLGAPVAALAAPAVDATVAVYIPDHGGVIPLELRPAREQFERKGYTGASLAGERAVHLVLGAPVHVEAGRAAFDLELLSLDAGRGRVRITRPAPAPVAVATLDLAVRRFVVVVDGR